MRRWIAWLTVFAVATQLAVAPVASQALQVIELQYRTAEEIIPILQPLVEEGGALSGQDYTLFVRTSSANLEQLRAAVKQIDRKPRQLRVSVRRATVEQMRREGVSASGTIGRDTNVTIQGTRSNERVEGGGVANVTVIEGNSAFISSATSVPVVTVVAGGGGRRPWGAAATGYRDLTNGFLVTPRIAGPTVMLDVEQVAEELRDGAVQSQRLTTQLSARFGEWVRLGGIQESSSRQSSGIASRRYTTREDEQSVWIKVDQE